MQINFDAEQTLDNWRPVNDGVMGGRSSGGLNFQDGVAVFQGSINTNGGGFSSVRTKMPPGSLKNISGLRFRVKSDGRIYKITLQTNAKHGGRPVSFQAELLNLPAGDWGETTVSFTDLRASVFGRQLQGKTFDKNKIVELGIILADGKDGPFKLEIDWIKACEN